MSDKANASDTVAADLRRALIEAMLMDLGCTVSPPSPLLQDTLRKRDGEKLAGSSRDR